MSRLTRGPLAAWRAVTPTGRGVLLLGAAAEVASSVWGFGELRVLALTCVWVVVVSVAWLVVRTRVAVDLRVTPQRATAGDTVVVEVVATNHGWLPLWQPLVRLPVGDDERWVRMGSLPPGRERRARVPVGGLRRGVLEVGPAAAVRADPLGLLRRSVPWGGARELFVRPRFVVLPRLGVGHLRDLEGTPSDRLSMSDLAFHALREYVPGDDLRHVHWRSSARAGELLVRQYHDTRRNHATVVVDGARDSYPDDEAFELAASVAASLLVCAAREEYDTSLACGPVQVAGQSAPVVLDGTCRMEPGASAGPLSEQVADALRLAPDTSVLLVVTGAGRETADLVAMTSAVPGDVGIVALVAAPGEVSRVTPGVGHVSLTVGALAELPGLMAVLP